VIPTKRGLRPLKLFQLLYNTGEIEFVAVNEIIDIFHQLFKDWAIVHHYNDFMLMEYNDDCWVQAQQVEKLINLIGELHE
jgi:hypothetical protein